MELPEPSSSTPPPVVPQANEKQTTTKKAKYERKFRILRTPLAQDGIESETGWQARVCLGEQQVLTASQPGPTLGL
jgi:hypothetical protein